MIDMHSFNKALKATWIKTYLDTENHGKWKSFFDIELEKFGYDLPFTSNLNKKDTGKWLNVTDSFLKEILLIWAETNVEEQLVSERHFLEQNLWFNSLIRINNAPIFCKEWERRGIRKIKHLKETNNNFLSLQELRKKYSFKLQPLTYFGLISALKSLWKTSNRRDLTNNCKEYESFSSKLIKCQKLSNDRLVAMKASTPTLSQHKWLQDCNLRQNETN